MFAQLAEAEESRRLKMIRFNKQHMLMVSDINGKKHQADPLQFGPRQQPACSRYGSRIKVVGCGDCVNHCVEAVCGGRNCV